MASKQRILVVFGTRPEAIKLFPLIRVLKADPRFEAVVCTTGQHRDMLDQVLEVACITPDHDLGLMREGQSLDELTCRLIAGLGPVIDSAAPACILVQGDTTTALAGALAAYYRRVPVAHVEAGLRSNDNHNPWPEEVNRKLIAAIALLHFAPTETAQRALYTENIDPTGVHLTGNTGIDALHWINAQVEQAPALAARIVALEERFRGKRIIGVTCHRRENFGHGIDAVVEAVCELAKREDVAFVVPLHKNPNAGAVMSAGLAHLDNVALVPPLGYPDFARLLKVSHLMLTDSGGVQEEAPAVGTPVLVLRRTTERPEGVAAGTALLVGADATRIVFETARLLDDPAAHARMARAHNPYGDGQSALRIAELLAELPLPAEERKLVPLPGPWPVQPEAMRENWKERTLARPLREAWGSLTARFRTG